MKKVAIYSALWLALFGLRMLFAWSHKYAGWGHGSWGDDYVKAALFASLSLGLVLVADWRTRALRRPKA